MKSITPEAMKKSLLSLVILMIICFSCKEEEEPILYCGVVDPAQNLTWLNQLTNELDESYLGIYFYVSAAIYENNRVFLVENCCPFCNSVTLVYNCKGEILGALGKDGAGIEPTEVTDKVIVWRGTDFACNL